MRIDEDYTYACPTICWASCSHMCMQGSKLAERLDRALAHRQLTVLPRGRTPFLTLWTFADRPHTGAEQ